MTTKDTNAPGHRKAKTERMSATKAVRPNIIDSWPQQSRRRRFAQELVTNVREAVFKGNSIKRPQKLVYISVRGKTMKISPSALAFVKRQTLKSIRKYKVTDETDRQFISGALIAVGITEATKLNANMVTVVHIERGWKEQLAICPGNQPPYLCAGRSILQRKSYICNLKGPTGELLREGFDIVG